MMTKSSKKPQSFNELTLLSYELTVNDYVNGTVAEVSGNIKKWIDDSLAPLSPKAAIFEIGSAFGRDAQYIESHGFTVERTDATDGFVTWLQQNGYSAKLFNVLTDNFSSSYDLIFANAVFLHFTPHELNEVLGKVHKCLKNKGTLAFSLKRGIGEEWTMAKLGQPRYVCYWTEDKIEDLLKARGFVKVSFIQDEQYLLIIAQP